MKSVADWQCFGADPNPTFCFDDNTYFYVKKGFGFGAGSKKLRGSDAQHWLKIIGTKRTEIRIGTVGTGTYNKKNMKYD